MQSLDASLANWNSKELWSLIDYALSDVLVSTHVIVSYASRQLAQAILLESTDCCFLGDDSHLHIFEKHFSLELSCCARRRPHCCPL